MLAFLTRRILLALPALLGVALVVFLLMRAVPGDVVTNLVGLEGNVTPERRAELQRMLGSTCRFTFSLYSGSAPPCKVTSAAHFGRAARSASTWRCGFR